MDRCARCRRHLVDSRARTCPFCAAPRGVTGPLPFALGLGLAAAGCVVEKNDSSSGSGDASTSTTATGGEMSTSSGGLETGTSDGTSTSGTTGMATTGTTGDETSGGMDTYTTYDSGAFYGAPSIPPRLEDEHGGPHAADPDARGLAHPGAVGRAASATVHTLAADAGDAAASPTDDDAR